LLAGRKYRADRDDAPSNIGALEFRSGSRSPVL